MFHGRNFFDQPIKNYLETYDNIERLKLVKVMITQQDVYQIIPILKYYELIVIDLSKQQKLGVASKAIQQINFTGNLDRAEGATMFFIIEEAKETVLDFSKGTVKVL